MYHRVVPAAAIPLVASLRQIVVSAETFERQIRIQASRRAVIALSRLAETLGGAAPLPPLAAAITFDDGWGDTFLHAFPVLRRLGLPATVFLTTGFIGSDRMFWQERLRALTLRLAADRAARGGAAGPPDLPAEVLGALACPDAETGILALIEKAKYMAEADRAGLMERVERLAGSARGSAADDGFLTWGQVREMAGAGIEFGSHGESHEILTGLPGERVAAELRRSRERIERETGRQCLALAYPNGDCDDAVAGHAAAAGYALALTTGPGINTRRTPPHRLRRIDVNERRFADCSGRFSEAMFAAALAGLL
jgi:peptidoglycan/xylan/chitin deacetylase (PgdA/CDA1 family)